MRAILDANVVVSAVLTPGGPAADLIRATATGAFEFLTCGQLVTEVSQVLMRKKFEGVITPEERRAILALLVNRARMVPDLPPDGTEQVADPKDAYLITLAREWRAALVTGDRHLLDLPGPTGIMSPRAFLRLLTRPGA